MTTRLAWSVGLLGLAACASPSASEIDRSGELTASATLTLACDGGAEVAISRVARGFDVKATSGNRTLFQAREKQPALNVRVEDGTSTVAHELVDFNDAGLEAIPVDGPTTLEIDFAVSPSVIFRDPSQNVTLTCDVDPRALLGHLGLTPVALEAWQERAGDAKAVAFDIDDTLAFTTPAFTRGFATGGTPVPQDTTFWTAVNGCDSGCPAATITLPDGTVKELPANAASTAKEKARALVAFHKSRGARVYAITARPDINGAPVRSYVERELGIAQADVFFEPDIDQPGNPKGKTDRIEALALDVFYGDSDSDITDARHAFEDGRAKAVAAVRFLRSPRSSNRKAGQLSKYHPGYFGEPVLEGTYD